MSCKWLKIINVLSVYLSVCLIVNAYEGNINIMEKMTLGCRFICTSNSFVHTNHNQVLLNHSAGIAQKWLILQ